MQALWQASLPKAKRKPNRSQAQAEKEITFNLLIQYNRIIMYIIHNRDNLYRMDLTCTYCIFLFDILLLK